MSESLPVIFGLSGLCISDAEAAFFAQNRPFGYILFARNVADTPQLSALTDSLKALHGDPDVPIFIDQEGGRVQRLRAPLAPDYPSARVLGDLHAHDAKAGERAAWLLGRLHALDLGRHGINANCVPVLDVPTEGAHDVIGHRAYGLDPETVFALGKAMAAGTMAGGALPVMKHVPGHGRANADSHKALPRVDADLSSLQRRDFVPFAGLRDLPAAMTAHIVYEAIDPERPATLSPVVIETIIRGEIGFDGLLMSDDVSMHALSGDFDARARAILDAGCDIVLHCNGDMDEMTAVASVMKPLTGRALQRARQAQAVIGRTGETSGDGIGSEQALRSEFSRLLGVPVA